MQTYYCAHDPDEAVESDSTSVAVLSIDSIRQINGVAADAIHD